MIYNKLGSTDMVVSAFSLGGSAFGRVFGETSEEEIFAVVKKALDSGVNMLDTAPWYGQGESERVLGKVIPQLDRSKFYLNTKVGRYELEPTKMFDFSAERVTRSVDDSLKLLNVDYIDIIQVHDVEFAANLSQIAHETLPALQKVKEQGKARYIGITGYPIDILRKLVDMSPVKIDTVLSYCHGCMLDNSLQEHLDFFESKGTGVINASGLSMGLLTDNGPAPWHPAGKPIKEACRKAASYCKEKGTNIAKLAVHFCVTQPKVSSTLFSTAKMSELEENLANVNNGLTEEESQTMHEVIERFFNPLETRSWEGVEIEQYLKDIGRDSMQ